MNYEDEFPDYTAINECIKILHNYCRKWGRLGGQTKEKYGTIRFYANFGSLNLHTLFYPGYVYNQFPKWLWSFDILCISKILNPFNRLFVKWQKFIYNKAYQKCLKLYPQTREALLLGADYPELITGATKIEGKKKHILGWNGEILGTWTSL